MKAIRTAKGVIVRVFNDMERTVNPEPARSFCEKTFDTTCEIIDIVPLTTEQLEHREREAANQFAEWLKQNKWHMEYREERDISMREFYEIWQSTRGNARGKEEK